jgi:hypothetical protein
MPFSNDVQRGVRHVVVTSTMTERGERVPVTWSFASRRGAEELARRHKIKVRTVRRAEDAVEQDQD